MNILFITSNRLGDAVLSTGVLDHVLRAHPGASVTVACGPLAASVFEGVPGLARIISLKKQQFHGHWINLWKEVFRTRWDIVIDFRDSIVSRLIRADKIYIYTNAIDRKLHKVEQGASVLGLAEAPSPVLWPTAAQLQAAEKFIPAGGPVLAVGPTANWIGKTWPADRFITVVSRLTAPDGLFPNARVAVFAAPGEEAEARKVLESVPAARRIDMIAKADPGTAAAALKRCAFYIGNDSGLMHCAAAAGIPTVGLFGPSWPHLYRPWGRHTTYIKTPQDFNELTHFAGYDPKTLKHTLMNGLTVETVMQEIARFKASY